MGLSNIPYTQFHISGFETESDKEILIAILGDQGCDTFEEGETDVKAFFPVGDFSSNDLNQVLEMLPFGGSLSVEESVIEPKNWNAEWESNFKPITINNWRVRAPFHAEDPNFENELVINPEMAFGTGHHQTTA